MSATPTATVIRNAAWVVGWDSQAKSHVYLRDVDVAFIGKVIAYVGKSYQGPCDHQIDGAGLMVMPGLINIHAHPGEDTFVKGINEYGFDAGEEGELAFLDVLKSPNLRGTDEVDLRPLGAGIGYAELLLSGVTTLVDISESSYYPGWIELLERSGLRAYLAPTFPSFTSQEPLEGQLAQALALIDQAIASQTGRLSGVVVPFDVLSLPAELLRVSRAEAQKRGIPWKIHAAEAIVEFREMVEKHGLSPIQWLDQLGLLGPGTILAHAIFFDHHPALKWDGPSRDLGLVAQSGASVSHAPYGFALSCVAMDGFSRYREAGINVGLGTDTFGHNLFEEMRLAMLLSRIVSGRVQGSTTADVFHAATVGGAQALQRVDIGRLVRNTKADLVLVDLNHPAMQPVNDPLRSLILQAGERAIRDVYVDGEKVVENGQVLTLDHRGMSKELDMVIQRLRQVPIDRREAKWPPQSKSTVALPAGEGITLGVNQIVNRREVLHGRLADMPYGQSVPDIPGIVVRGLVPYGSSRTLDVAVVTMSPGAQVMIEGYVPAGKDWYVHSLSGTGLVETDAERMDVGPGTIIIVPPGTSGHVANQSDSPWVWFSIHPLFEEEYNIEGDPVLTEEYIGKVRAMRPERLVHAEIEDASFREVPGLAGLYEHQLVLSQDFDVSLRRLQPGTRLPEVGPLSHDLYVHGLTGRGVVEVKGRPMELGPDSFVFLPEGTVYALSTTADSGWEFMWMHPPGK